MTIREVRSDLAKPSSLGYRMPAEWECHDATWLTWPRSEGISFPNRNSLMPVVWVRLIELLSQVEEVHINVFDADANAKVNQHLDGSCKVARDRVHLHEIPAYEPWCRDHGPIFVRRSVDGQGEMAVVNWEYNAWGGKYPPFDLDNHVPAKVASLLGIPEFVPGIVLEGGSIDVNGNGSLLTSESCLLNPNRNCGLSREEIEMYLRDYLGVEQILWLGAGITGDDTDGHIDDTARFLALDVIAAVVEADRADENHAVLEENLRRLEAMRDVAGKQFTIVELPMPQAMYFDGQRLPASYANFYMANEIVLVPVFSCRQDDAACRILDEALPDHRIIPFDATDLIWGLGAIHCITQQQPSLS